MLIALLKLIEYKHFVRVYPTELYGGIVALVFTVIGVYAGLRLRRDKPHAVVVVREVAIPDPSSQPATPATPFVPDPRRREDLGITLRELQILALIAEGLSNREIGERLFVSENTVKSHSSRLFDKLGVQRRTQAVQKGKQLGLIA